MKQDDMQHQIELFLNALPLPEHFNVPAISARLAIVLKETESRIQALNGRE